MIGNEIAKKMVAYFENIKEERDLTYEEKELYREFKGNIGTFVVTCVTREDLENVGYDATEVSDEVMERIADKMGDTFNDDGIYWTSLEEEAGYHGIPMKED